MKYSYFRPSQHSPFHTFTNHWSSKEAKSSISSIFTNPLIFRLLKKSDIHPESHGIVNDFKAHFHSDTLFTLEMAVLGVVSEPLGAAALHPCRESPHIIVSTLLCTLRQTALTST